MQRFRSRAFCRLLPSVLALSVTACASNCPAPSGDWPRLPPPPLPSTPAPSTPYSDSAASELRSWQRTLMDTQLMQPTAARPGR